MLDNPRLLLARLREGDYAHAGEAEAIDIVLSYSQIKAADKILDAGCGLGGTAEYIREKTAASVFGVDLDKAAIMHAISNYPDVHFIAGDILKLPAIFTIKFQYIYMFNVFYALSDQQQALKSLRGVVDEGAVLAIFDYVLLDETKSFSLLDLADRRMNPIFQTKFEADLNKTGWDLFEKIDLNKKYLQWYQDFLDKLDNNKEMLLNEFTAETYDKVHTTFMQLLDNIKNNMLGGAVYFVKAKRF